MIRFDSKFTTIISLLIIFAFSSCTTICHRAKTESQPQAKNEGLGNLTGLVTNEYDQPIPGVFIVIQRTPLKINGDTLGQYIIRNIPPGIYEVEAITIGYKKIIIPDVGVYADSTTVLNFSMEFEPIILHNFNSDPKRK